MQNDETDQKPATPEELREAHQKGQSDGGEGTYNNEYEVTPMRRLLFSDILSDKERTSLIEAYNKGHENAEKQRR